MNIDEYQKLASRTMKMKHFDESEGQESICIGTFCDSSETGISPNLLMGAMGLSGESGELMDHIKKALFQGHDICIDKIINEVGDVLWYVAAVATALNKDLSEIAQHNVDKLKKRYPAGFSEERSIHREEGVGIQCNDCYGIRCGLMNPLKCSHFKLKEYDKCLTCESHCLSCKGRGRI